MTYGDGSRYPLGCFVVTDFRMFNLERHMDSIVRKVMIWARGRLLGLLDAALVLRARWQWEGEVCPHSGEPPLCSMCVASYIHMP